MPTADANLVPLSQAYPDSKRVIHYRAPLERVLSFLGRGLEEFLPPMRALMGAYRPPLTAERGLNLVLAECTEEQKSIGVPKVIGGVEMDGSADQIEIL